MSVTLYGIKQCDSVKKAKKWLDAHQIDYNFHDFRADGLSAQWLNDVEAITGWETLLNKRSTTFRELSDDDKSALSQQKALTLMTQHPTLIKRPVMMVHNAAEPNALVGFKAEQYAEVFAQ